MFHSVQAAAVSAPHGVFPAVHQDQWFLKYRCSTVTTVVQPAFTHRETTTVVCRVSRVCWITDFQNLNLIVKDLPVLRALSGCDWFWTKKTPQSKLLSTIKFPAAYEEKIPQAILLTD